jgi:hypothetical protein
MISLHASRYRSRDANIEDVEISVVAVFTTAKTTATTSGYVSIESGSIPQVNVH